MDEDALRAMMPMSFGKSKKAAPKPKPKPEQPPAAPALPSASTSSSVVGATLGNKRPAPSSPPPDAPKTASEPAADDEVDENGLTAADRALNAQLELGGDSDDDDSDDDDTQGRPGSAASALADIKLPPMSHEAVLESHSKSVSALALDPGGARIATGSFDYDLKLWDFGGMDSTLKPFRSFEPAGSYPINDVAFSPHAGGEHLLCISATAAAKVYDRDGTELGTCKKGDPYLRDMRQTKGHVSELTAGAWDPSERGRFMTASSDSTVRFWHLDDLAAGQRDVIVVKSRERGTRTKVTAARYAQEGRILAAAGLDGALHWWDLRANLASKPRGTVERAHESGCGISCITFSRDSNTLVTRGGDETVKLWDRRMFRSPAAVRAGLPSTAMTDVVFSPDEKSVLAGVAAVPLAGESRGSKNNNSNNNNNDDDDADDDGAGATRDTTTGGAICVLSLPNLDEVRRYSISPSSVLRLHWHTRLNQLFATTRAGNIHVFYSPEASVNGALLAVGRKPRQRNPFNVDLSPVDVPADATLPQSNAAKRRRLEKMRADPVASRMPQRPMEGKGKGGRIGAAAMQHVVQNLYRTADDTRSQDPREALLKYAEQAEKDPIYTKVWKETQPKTLYAQDDDDDGDDGDEQKD
ncbi:uncharacterized protein PFL1_01543 [Pseudozyma flocculosa PF-1]|uniref:Uncharacterized protein n=1 Tax=Pseudozyma flocculosa TaxID=84751 RepID=A0A5C3F032_9BASI|nr:uncharacterized protein PFL1_01543 [Pseudozyma flocculosa PF-1]EPQ30642.1 hypothetical protein PFL1_01543 [Pseudozyma flocculosa PF-1]SPO37027.1 uncharacterized protein PSFLO_02499 [Pseudozyma flocculosa]